MGRAILVLAAMLWPIGGLVAQTEPANSSANSSGSGDSVGPGELRDFSLGNRTAPTPTVEPDLIVSPRRTLPRPQPSTDRAVVTAPAPRPRPAPVSPTIEAPQPAVTPTPDPPTATRPAASVTIALPPADPLSRRPTPAGEADVPRLSTGSDAPFDSALSDDVPGGVLPWLIALLIAGGAGLAWFLRRHWSDAGQREPALAGGPSAIPSELPRRTVPPAPVPAPMPTPKVSTAGGITIKRPDAIAGQRPSTAPAAPADPAAPPRPVGIVSTRLRPWLELSFEPSRATIDAAQANVSFDVVVTNSGNAPARQVLVEACMVNAGPEQDVELRRFFEAPVGAGERIDSIPPLGKIQLKSAVSLPLDQVRAYEVGGRKLFVPLVAFNALYEWGSNEGQSSAAFILGRGTGSGEGEPDAKMAPLRLDLGPRVFRELDSRRHTLGMRR